MSERPHTMPADTRPRWHTLAVFLAIVLGVTAMAAVFTYVTLSERHEKRQLALAGELRLLALGTVADALLASAGDEHAFARVEQARRRGDTLLQRLERGDPQRDLPPLPAPARPALEKAKRAWQAFQAPLQTIVDTRPEILTVREYIRALNDFQPQLSALVDATAHVLLDAQAPPLAVYHATRQALLAQRIATTANRLLSEGALPRPALQRMRNDLEAFRRSLDALRHGSGDPDLPPRIDDPRARTQLDALAALFDTVAELVARIAEQGPALSRLEQARRQLEERSNALRLALAELTAAIARLPESRPVSHLTAYLIGAVVAGLFLLLGLFLVRDTRLRFQAERQRHQRQQQAIHALSQEIRPLGQGDLTIHASARDPLLEPIAEALNYAVDALRQLVDAIDRTAHDVAVTADETQATALHLRRASHHQSDQIGQVAQRIVDLARDSDNVHREAKEAEHAAGEALRRAEQGAHAVRECQAGLRALDEQMGRTAKRVKRLGEGVQEIGDIAELIADIADQTNILALNAAIHATANDVESEFAHIADEVQQLAERTNQATRRIEALIRTIQSDTQETIDAMEQSREKASATVRRAERAGLALVEIQSTVARLGDWVEAVAHVARTQAGEARAAAETMDWIRGVAVRNLAGSEQTAELARELARQAQALTEVIAGFRRPRRPEKDGRPGAEPRQKQG